MTKKSNYATLDNLPKEPMEVGQQTLFKFPEGKIGGLYGEKKFITIYFDTEEDYDKAVTVIGKASVHTKEHPIIDTEKFLRLIDMVYGPTPVEQ